MSFVFGHRAHLDIGLILIYRLFDLCSQIERYIEGAVYFANDIDTDTNIHNGQFYSLLSRITKVDYLTLN
jgi:hypothetical protein